MASNSLASFLTFPETINHSLPPGRGVRAFVLPLRGGWPDIHRSKVSIMRRKGYKQIPWTVEEYTVLFEFCEDKGPKFCMEVLNAKGYPRTESSVTNACHLLGLKYNGPRLGCFKKGQTPPNKGKKMPEHLREKAAATMFKKGNMSGAAQHNYVPVGHKTVRADGYSWTKVAEGKWRQTHQIIWEQNKGPIPPGHIIVFKDGNPHNLSLDNLEAITKKELVHRNRWGSGPSEFSLISGRAAAVRLNKRGFGDRVIRHNPELLDLAKAETLLKLKTRQRNATRT